jgi:hypothetical protein
MSRIIGIPKEIKDQQPRISMQHQPHDDSPALPGMQATVPIQELLEDLSRQCLPLRDSKVADHIPELAQ